ncbi:hypothetical protein OF83DRAFT_1124008, partial [Amylostereum chailletii]
MSLELYGNAIVKAVHVAVPSLGRCNKSSRQKISAVHARLELSLHAKAPMSRLHIIPSRPASNVQRSAPRATVSEVTIRSGSPRVHPPEKLSAPGIRGHRGL